MLLSRKAQEMENEQGDSSIKINSDSQKKFLSKEEKTRDQTSNFPLKLALFVFLAFQIAAYFLLVRYTRTREGNMYYTSTAVFLTEFMKLLISLLIVLVQQGNFSKFLQFIESEIIRKPMDLARLMVPSVLYMVQNNLLYVAMTHLEAVTFQITNQLKILSAAIFSIIVLGKRINLKQWICLLMLILGVALVQVETYSASIETGNVKVKTESGESERSFFTGLCCVLLASATSGFAGVYLEKRVKRAAQTSFWANNIHLYLSGSILALAGTFVKERKAISENGFFFGYDFVIWIMILIGTLDGLCISMILKYAGTITKGFATSFAILLSSLVSVYWFGVMPSLKFVSGSVIVVVAVTTYGL